MKKNHRKNNVLFAFHDRYADCDSGYMALCRIKYDTSITLLKRRFKRLSCSAFLILFQTDPLANLFKSFHHREHKESGQQTEYYQDAPNHN